MNGNQAVIGGAIALAAVICAGAASDHLPGDGGSAVLVEEVYTVRPGDTLWGRDVCGEEYRVAPLDPRVQGGDVRE